MTLTLGAVLAELPTLDRPLKPLVPSFLDPELWRGAQNSIAPRSVAWAALRKTTIARDGGCVYCQHATPRHLEVNHLHGHADNRPESLETVCVLCHRVLHAGRSAAIFGSLLLFQQAACDQNTIIRLSWHMRTVHHLRDRPLMALLGLADPLPFRMDRPYLARLTGYVVERYWLLERSDGAL